jgi:nitrite reductase (NO-forming)/hydroxylamine reductase
MAAVTAAVTKGGCGACHVMPGIPNAMGVVGPDMSNIGNEAGTRVPGETAEQYLYESIVNPNAHTAPNCPFGPCVAGAMPANLSQLLSEDEINIIVQYMLAQKGG